MLTYTEENYLKALFQIASERSGRKEAGTNELAVWLDVKPATVNNMLKKLRDKKLITYEKYGKISLTRSGAAIAVNVIRKHRLWETFLYEKLDFNWDEVHEVAEQLEHIQSVKLVEKLDKYLGFPKFDPHGDPIPDAKGVIPSGHKIKLSEVEPGKRCRMVAVKDNTASFLKYVDQVGLKISSPIRVLSRQSFDGSMEIEVGGKVRQVSNKFAENILVI